MQRQLGSTAYHIVFLMVDSNDHVTAKTGLTPTVTLSKNGAAYGAAAGTVSEIANGVYKLAANATDLNTLGTLALHAAATGADPVDMLLEVVSHDPFAAVAEILTDTGTTIPAQVSAIATWTAANINSGLTAGTITQVRGNSWSFQVTGLTLYATKQQFVIKRNSQDTDAGALLFIDSVTGLITLNGVSTGLTAADASIVYAGTTLTVTVDASATAQLERGSWVYGIQSIHSDGTVSEVYGGTFIITGDTVRAVA